MSVRAIVALILVLLAGALAVSLYLAGGQARAGRARHEALEAKRDTLLGAVIRSRRQAAADREAVERARAAAEREAARYRLARGRVRVVRDTVYAADLPAPLTSPAIADLITTCDSALVAADSLIGTMARHMAAQDTVITRQAAVIALDTEMITDLEKTKKGPRCGRRCGIVIGSVGTVLLIYLAGELVSLALLGGG